VAQRGTGGYRSFIGFDPTRRIGVVVLCNNGNENAMTIGFHLLDETFRFKSPPPRRTEVAVDSLLLERYIGEYEFDARSFTSWVTRQGSAFVRSGKRAAAVSRSLRSRTRRSS